MKQHVVVMVVVALAMTVSSTAVLAGDAPVRTVVGEYFTQYG